MNNIKVKPIGFVAGSPGSALDRFYQNPSHEEERRFNLINIRHLFGDSRDSGVGEELTSTRKRSRSIWSTDDEDGESDQSLSSSPPTMNEILPVPQPQRHPINLLNPELRRLYPEIRPSVPIFPKPDDQYASLQNPDLKRYYAPPDIHEARMFKVHGLAALFSPK